MNTNSYLKYLEDIKSMSEWSSRKEVAYDTGRKIKLSHSLLVK